MKTIFTLVKKDFKLFFNDKVGFSLTFIVPVILIYIFGSIFGGGGGSASGIRLAVLNKSNAPIAKKIEQTLDTSKSFDIIKTHKDDKNHELVFDSLSIKEYVAKGNAAGALVIPEDAYTDTSTGLRVKFYYDPKNEIESQMLQGLLKQAVMQSAPELFKESMLRKSRKYLGQDTGTRFNHDLAGLFNRYFKVDTNIILHPGAEKSPAQKTDTVKASADFMNNMLQLESQQVVGNDIKNPNVTRNVGGWALMFLLFSLTASASSLFEEEKSGVMLRILSAPVRGTHILWSKYIYNILLGIIQLSVMFSIGALLFRIDIFSNFLNLFAVILAGAVACTSLGMLLAAYCKTEAQARGLGTFLILTMSAIGGAWFPTFLMPPFIQQISKLTIVYWTVDGFMQVLWRNASFAEILPNISFLIGFASAVSFFSVLKFRKNRF